MSLFDYPKNDKPKITISPNYCCEIREIEKSENTSSMYAYVKVYDNFNYVASGWISLNSNNFVISSYETFKQNKEKNIF